MSVSEVTEQLELGPVGMRRNKRRWCFDFEPDLPAASKRSLYVQSSIATSGSFCALFVLFRSPKSVILGKGLSEGLDWLVGVLSK